MENINSLVGQTIEGENGEDRKIVSARFIGATVELKTEEVKKEEYGINKAIEYILLVEGGYSNHPADKGGATNYGIIETEARKYGYKGNMKDMPKSIAIDIYNKKYWLKNNLDKIKDFRVALSIFDWTVNSGNWGTKKAQIAINQVHGKNVLSVDGAIGNNSLKYLNEVNPDKFLDTYHSLQETFYRSLAKNKPSQAVFLKGWLNRIQTKKDFIKKL